MNLVEALPAFLVEQVDEGRIGIDVDRLAGACADVLYGLIIGMVLYGGIRPSKIYDMLVETAALSGAILIILGTASAMAWTLTQTGFAFKMAAMVTELPGC